MHTTCLSISIISFIFFGFNMRLIVMKEQEEEFCDPPVGYRFVPTDEELVNHYLIKKIFCDTFESSVFLETSAPRLYTKQPKSSVPLFRRNREWFFFIHKIGNNETIRRVKDGGFWQPNGEKPILDAKGRVIAFKIQLIYFSGCSSKPRKTHWRMDEYRMPIQFYSDHHMCEEWAVGRLTRGKDDCNL